jgi:LemA protein
MADYSNTPKLARRLAIIGGIAAVAIVAIIIGVLYSMYFSGYNGAQSKDENVKRLSADVDAQLQRRYDLIPNLVESVKGYMQFESELLQNVTKLRTDWQRADTVNERVETSNQLESALSKIILVYESYPDLKSDAQVTRLMDELAGTENRIAVARTYYNDGVRDYNTHLRTFPNNMFNEDGFLGASAWGLQPYPPYEATAGAQTNVPQVDLTN